MKIFQYQSELSLVNQSLKDGIALKKDYMSKREIIMIHFYKIEHPNSNIIDDDEKEKLGSKYESLKKKGLISAVDIILNDSLFKAKTFKLKLEKRLKQNELELLNEFSILDKLINENDKDVLKNDLIVTQRKQEIDYLISKRAFFLTNVVGIGMFLYILLFLGFVFWYKNSQRYQDIVIKEQAGYKYRGKVPIVKYRSKVLLERENWVKEIDVGEK